MDMHHHLLNITIPNMQPNTTSMVSTMPGQLGIVLSMYNTGVWRTELDGVGLE